MGCVGVCGVGVCWGYGSVVGVVWCGKVFGGGVWDVCVVGSVCGGVWWGV